MLDIAEGVEVEDANGVLFSTVVAFCTFTRLIEPLRALLMTILYLLSLTSADQITASDTERATRQRYVGLYF